MATAAGRPEATSNGVPVDVALQLGEHGYWGYWEHHLDQEFTFTPGFAQPTRSGSTPFGAPSGPSARR